MRRSFRFAPPTTRVGLLPRPRLLAALQQRWHHRVTVVAGGPGLGKTTLLAQAVHANRVAPWGDDVWLGLVPGEDAVTLSLGLATALARRPAAGATAGQVPVPDTGSEPVPAEVVAGAVWRRAPVEVCLVLDDVHLLAPGSPGAAWLAELLDALPANGHALLATRGTAPPVPLARRVALGEVGRLAEDDLRFDDDELAAFAADRGLHVERFRGTGGWPAVAELSAGAGPHLTRSYLLEEVLQPLGPERRCVLAALVELGGADAELAAAALGGPVDLRAALDGVPLVAHDADGWYLPHALWRDAPDLGLDPDDRRAVHERALDHLVARERFDDAFALLRQAERWDLAPGVLRAACLAGHRRHIGRLDRWLADCPEPVRASPAGRLAAGLHAALTDPAGDVEPLREAAAACRAAGDVDAEVVAISHLGRLGWFRQDPAVFGPEMWLREEELAVAGHPHARAMHAFGHAALADVAGDDDAVLDALAAIEPGLLDPAWSAMVSWMHVVVRLGAGDAEGVADLVEELAADADPGFRTVVDGFRLRTWWSLGRVDDVLEATPAALAGARATRVAAIVHLGLTNATIMYAYVGDVEAARRCLDEALAASPRAAGLPHVVRDTVATAAVRLAEGDEAAAAARLREAVAAGGLDRGMDRRVWRHTLALTDVLLPETRGYWDERPLRGELAVARRLAAAVVALRDGGGERELRTLDVPATGMVRATLPARFAAELAVGLDAAGRPEGRALLEALGPAGRSVVRGMAATAGAGSSKSASASSRSSGSGSPGSSEASGPSGSPTGSAGAAEASAPPPPVAKAARALLAAVPAPPPQPTHLGVLGPLLLHRGGPRPVPDDDPDLRRARVRALLAFLVGHRLTTRAALAAALWPDLPERQSGNNLAVTLNHAQRLLEPWRPPGEPGYLLRLDRHAVRLVTGEHLQVDVDVFDRHLADAARAEDDGVPSTALTDYLAALDLYRGDLGADVPDAPWLAQDRERHRSRFVVAATRAGQLLLGRGDPTAAEEVARRVIDVDPQAEPAHALLVGVALATGDRPAARRRLDRCLALLADLGVAPSEATRRLVNRLRAEPAQPGA